MPNKSALVARLCRLGGVVALSVMATSGWAQGLPALGFTPPPPGSYSLQHIQPAADGRVLDTQGSLHRLREYTRGRITLLAFVYSSCNDPQGCPFVYLVFNQVRDAFEKDPVFDGKVGLVSLSFDPAHDTPQRMAEYGGEHAVAGRKVRWDFLTTPSLKDLLPLLDGFGQDVLVETDPQTGTPTGLFGHVLKVFLIDAEGWVREIYTTAYLHPQVLLNDVRTLLLERSSAKSRPR